MLAHVSATGSVKPLKTSYYTYSSLSVLEVRLHSSCWVCIYSNNTTIRLPPLPEKGWADLRQSKGCTSLGLELKHGTDHKPHQYVPDKSNI